MNKDIALRILDLQESMKQDFVYQTLLEEHDTLNHRFLAITAELTKQQQSTIYDYVGCLIELHLKTLEYALKE